MRGALPSLRVVVAVGVLAALSACGGRPAEPRHKGRTAAQWVEGLFSLVDPERDGAEQALIEFAEKEPEAVLAALTSAITSPPRPPVGAPFELVLDRAAAKRLGLADVDEAEAVALDLAVLRCRARTAGVVLPYFRALSTGMIRVTIPPLPRAEVLAVQRMLATRGDLDLRPVYVPPDADAVAPEAAKWLAAREAGVVYVPTDPRRRAAPTRADPTGPEDFVLVTEPATAAEALDESLAASAEARVGGGKPPIVWLRVRQDRRDLVRGFTETYAGKTLAILLGGVVRATVPIRPFAGDVLELPLWKEADEASVEEARDLSVVIGCAARLPRPLRGTPLAPGVGEDPPAENPVSRLFVALGPRSLPVLEAVQKRDVPAWSKASAAWAAERLRGESRPP